MAELNRGLKVQQHSVLTVHKQNINFNSSIKCHLSVTVL